MLFAGTAVAAHYFICHFIVIWGDLCGFFCSYRSERGALSDNEQRRAINMNECQVNTSRKREIPVWEKYLLSTEEASDYFHIGINKLRRIISLNPTAEWILWNGSHAYIKRRIFEQFIDRINDI